MTSGSRTHFPARSGKRRVIQHAIDQDTIRGVAQPGSALAWGARGQRFESARPDHLRVSYDSNPHIRGGVRVSGPQAA